MIGGFVNNSMNAALEATGFAQTESFDSPTGYAVGPARSVLASILTIVVMMALILFAGKYLWNTVLVSLVPAVKPAKSVWQILGLAILVSLFQPGCC
jgi:hypothetical protein